MDFVTTGKVRKNPYILSSALLTLDYKYKYLLDYKCLDTGGLEAVAGAYTANPSMQSPYLEWLLIDALLFDETGLFALTVCDIPAQKFIPMVMHSLLRPIKLLLSEGFAFALTAFVSSLIDETHSTAFWVIFATITLGRWLNPIKLQQVIQQQKPKELAADMISATVKSKKFDFNARLLRELLYGLEKRGAVYSPSVFNVLDKRIARE
jgi:hypothetical protein